MEARPFVSSVRMGLRRAHENSEIFGFWMKRMNIEAKPVQLSMVLERDTCSLGLCVFVSLVICSDMYNSTSSAQSVEYRGEVVGLWQLSRAAPLHDLFSLWSFAGKVQG